MMGSKCEWVKLLLLMFVFVLNENCLSEGCHEEERLALFQLKHFFDFPYRIANRKVGDENSDCCLWEVVECSNDSGRVKELNLNGARNWELEEWHLNASLFSPFQELELLDLSLNKIAGFVENEGLERLSSLTNLKFLYLGGNRFNNSILSSLGGLSSLKALNLFANRLEGAMDIKEFNSLSNLEKLDLSWNDIDKFVVPKGYRGLRKLNSLYLNGLLNINDGSTLLHSLGSFPSLKTLGLRFNNFSQAQFPTGLCELVHLQELDISGNDLVGILPWCLANITSLRVLDVSLNQLTGNISSSPLIHLTSIQHLTLSNNHFQIPISLGPFYNHSNLTIFHGETNSQVYAETDESQHSIAPKFQLISLTLPGHGYGGTLPKFLYHQHELKHVDLSHNNLIGNFPNWLLDNNTKLEALFLANNSLSGPFHMPSNRHRKLNTLDISDNCIRGPIPLEIGEFLPSLKNLNISRNVINGSIPSSFGNMNSLEILELSHNQLTDGIPEHLAMGCFSLQFLVLSSNSLRGHIFTNSFNLTKLERLQLDDNQFIGEIPECLSNGSSLKGLYLSDNHLLGRIPRWLGNLSGLEDIIMSNNHLEGPIPTEFCQLVSLENLDLSENNLSGSLPSCLGPSSIEQVHLSKNMLQGRLTDGTFFNSSSLVTLDLSHNLLFGSIPSWIDGLSWLRFLILASNNLESEVPVQLCRLNQLQLIDLSHNNLSGQIPSCLDNTALYEAIAPNFNHTQVPYGSFVNRSSMVKGQTVDFTTKSFSYTYQERTMSIMFGIDLSSNKLTGEIPPQIGYLTRTRALNLSHNNLTGSIPVTLSNLNQIESLDLSYNKLNGKIPPQLVKLNALAVFRVSHNNLSGKIPEPTAQFATFNESSYEENPLLCGLPLPKSCHDIESPPSSPRASIANQESNNLIDMKSFFTTFTVSYVIGFLGLIVVLYVNPYWRGRWFYVVETWMTSCFYFVVDHLPRRFCN